MAKNYARSLGYYSKTDKIDAKMLGQLALERQHRSWKSTPKNVRIIRDLLRQRVKLLNIKTQITNQIHAYSYSATKGEVNMKVYEDLLISLGEQIKVIAQAVKKEVELDKLLKANVALLESIPGVGFDTAVSILVETNQFINFTSGSKLISYAGYDILQRQSGTHVGKTKISKKGNKYIRRQLYCPAQSHVNRKGVFITLYQRLIDNGKKKLQASVAVQMRLLKLMFSLVKFGKTYNANYQHHTIQNGTPLAM
jgi:transposase